MYLYCDERIIYWQLSERKLYSLKTASGPGKSGDRTNSVKRTSEMLSGTPLPHMTRHMLGLAHGMSGARTFRRILGEDSRQPGAGPETIRRALAAVDLTAAPVAA